jgi:hypothetical protein
MVYNLECGDYTRLRMIPKKKIKNCKVAFERSADSRLKNNILNDLRRQMISKLFTFEHI